MIVKNCFLQLLDILKHLISGARISIYYCTNSRVKSIVLSNFWQNGKNMSSHPVIYSFCYLANLCELNVF